MSGLITQELIVEPNTGISRWEVKIKHDWNYLTYFITTSYKHGPALPCLLWKCGLLADAIRINPITITSSPTFDRDVFWESILKICKNVNPLNNPKNQTHGQNLIKHISGLKPLFVDLLSPHTVGWILWGVRLHSSKPINLIGLGI